MLVFVLILASLNNDFYTTMVQRWRRLLLHAPPCIRAVFYVSNPSLPVMARVHPAHSDVIEIRLPEDIAHTYEKLVMALRFCYRELDLGAYAYVVRPNLSSFLHLQRLTQICAAAPRTRYCGALPLRARSVPGLVFPSGACFIVSEDVARLLAGAPIPTPPPHVDDVGVGLLIRAHRVPLTPLPRWESRGSVSSLLRLFQRTPHYHIRCKVSTDPHQRDDDVVLFDNALHAYLAHVRSVM